MRGVGEEQYHDHEVKEQGVCAWVGASQSILGTRAPRRRSHVYKSWPTLNHSAWSTDHLTFSFCLTRKRSGPPPFSLLQFPKTRTHRTRVSPYSRDFLVPCWTPPSPPPFSGAAFSWWGDPPSMQTAYPHPLLLLHTHVW